MENKLDVIIFGASGYSGKYVVHKLHELTMKEQKSVKWGIAGRSKTKLEQVLQELEARTNQNFDLIPIFEADTQKPQSLVKLASRTKLIINCAGPFKVHGEPVIQACLQEKCHYIDITAEPQFMEKVQLIYDEEARRNGIFIVTSCGFDNIPSDMGLSFLEKHFQGTLNSAEMYLECIPDEAFIGKFINSGTWRSFVSIIEDYQELKTIRKRLFTRKLPELEPKLNMRWLHQIPDSQNFAGPYPGGEATVMRRSQRHYYETTQKRPIQIHTYLGFTKIWFYPILFLIFILSLPLFRFKFFTNFLSKHPEWFTFGLIGDNPKEETNQKLQIVFNFYGRGWKNKTVDEEFNKVEDSWMLVRVSGRNAYAITGLCAAASTLILLDDSQNLPKLGGVYTTSVMFRKSDLVEILHRNGLKFEVCADGSLQK